jgi:predicted lysophospholipase L1 biosynthesis ABC-type transport system permease subunit
MAKRAAIRNQRRLRWRASERDARQGRVALSLSRGFVTLVTALGIAAAMVGVASTVALAG